MFGSRNFLFAKGATGPVVFGGKLFMWGNNGNASLGLGNTTSYSSPVQVGALTDWAQVATGYGTIAVKTNGTLWAWGNNYAGTSGLNDTVARSSPVQVGALTTWSIPKQGRLNSFCIKTDGTLWAWGLNDVGQLGLGDTNNRSSPVQIGTSTTWTAISAGNNNVSDKSVAAIDNGKLFAWGRNATGQLGQSDTIDRSSPVQVGALTTWATPSSSSFTFCTKTDGTLWAWGSNANGQLGQNNTTYRSSPVQVGSLTNWEIPAVTVNHSICVKTDGTLFAWGGNGHGQLGLGNTTAYSSPKQVGSLTTWARPVTAPFDFSICAKTDGTLWSWGRNFYGNLGLGNTDSRSSPVQVGALTTWALPTAMSNATGCIQGLPIAAPVNLTLPIVSGTASEGQVLSSTKGTWSQLPTSFAFQWQKGTSNIVGATSSTYVIQAADVGSTLRCVVTATNAIGAASANSANTATVSALQGQLWNWGANFYGNLGQNNTTSHSSPVQVGSSTNWTYSAMGGYASFAVNSLGQLWSWGYNTYGRLGLGDTVNRSSPVQIGALTTWQKVFNGQQVCCAIKTDGTLWSWGRNTNGQLGLGNTTNYSSPKQIGGSTNWVTASVGGISGGTFAINSLGELWATGNNTSFGQLGLNDTTNRSSLTQVPGANWKNVFAGVSTCHAIKTDGTLWGWGRANDGVIGDNSTVYRSSPVQIGSDTNWSNVRKTSNYSTAAVRTNGTIWAWGNNGSGQLGLNDTTKRSSPVQVGALTTWVRVTNAGPYGCLARKTDGTLWSWGSNNAGSLGLGDITTRSSPVQIGSLTTWVINGFGATSPNSSAIKTP